MDPVWLPEFEEQDEETYRWIERDFVVRPYMNIDGNPNPEDSDETWPLLREFAGQAKRDPVRRHHGLISYFVSSLNDSSIL